ncbi:hypothetical protein ACIBCT_35480 [Streptosporangium sp. NPDC050855]|uniref:hypothetical protein n=1 Tax=Streptosporangium sp. NPDC050855 TaxID=3366194 RepID=UPI0037A13F4A
MARPYDSNSWYVPQGAGQSEALTTGGGGQLPVGWRDVLDARRSGDDPRTPEAQYPDGYLGTVPSRRSDRLLDRVKLKINSRPGPTGPHAGIRIDPGDYDWPRDFNMATSLEHQAQGKKWAPQGNPDEYLVNNGKTEVVGPLELRKKEDKFAPSQYTADRLRAFMPSWRT